MKIIVLNLETFLILQNDQIIFNMKTKYHKKLAKKQTTCVMNGQSKKKMEFAYQRIASTIIYAKGWNKNVRG